MPKPKPAFDEWGRFQGTPEQQSCIVRLMPVGVVLVLIGCGLVFMAGGNPGELDQAMNTAANSHIASSTAYGSGANGLSAFLCFGVAGMFAAIFVWGMSRRDGGNGED